MNCQHPVTRQVLVDGKPSGLAFCPDCGQQLVTPDAHYTSPKWPAPEDEEPDTETLIEWMDEEGGCEATDGCWVEPDGVCSHGYPSWLLYLGLI